MTSSRARPESRLRLFGGHPLGRAVRDLAVVGVAKTVATVGDVSVLISAGVVVGALMFAIKRSFYAAAPLLAFLGGYAMAVVLRWVIPRRRPPTADYPAPGAIAGVHKTSVSFPSGHAVAVTAVFFALLGLLALARRTWWPWLLALVLSAVVADSRLLLGVHWFSDVAIGMVLGISWGIVVAFTCTRLDGPGTRETEPPTGMRSLSSVPHRRITHDGQAWCNRTPRSRRNVHCQHRARPDRRRGRDHLRDLALLLPTPTA